MVANLLVADVGGRDDGPIIAYRFAHGVPADFDLISIDYPDNVTWGTARSDGDHSLAAGADVYPDIGWVF